jgi:hypothetical protein
MTTDTRQQASVFNFPVMMILTTIVCLVCYQALGFNTAIGVATASTVLAWFCLKRKDREPASDAN